MAVATSNASAMRSTCVAAAATHPDAGLRSTGLASVAVTWRLARWMRVRPTVVTIRLTVVNDLSGRCVGGEHVAVATVDGSAPVVAVVGHAR